MPGRYLAYHHQLRYQEAREKLGLDDPIPVRYVKWMGNLLKGNLGYSSFYKKDVKDCLSTPLLNTIQINIVSTILALAITIPLGIHCAVRKFSKFDNTVQVLTIVGVVGRAHEVYSSLLDKLAGCFLFILVIKTICENNKKMVSPGTLGILTNPEHPIFKGFPTEIQPLLEEAKEVDGS